MKLIRIVATLACALCLSVALAQDFPNKRITVIVPFPPGGSSDTTMRLMSNKLKDILGQPIIIDTRPGANGTIGAGMVARSAPDGYTLLIASIGTFAITPSLIANLPYHTRKDLEPLTLAVRTPNVMVVRNSLPVNSVAELMEYMKKNRGKVSLITISMGSNDVEHCVKFDLLEIDDECFVQLIELGVADRNQEVFRLEPAARIDGHVVRLS